MALVNRKLPQLEWEKFLIKGNDVVVRTVIVDDLGNQITDFGKRFSTNDVEEASSSLTYVGKEDADGQWALVKIDESSDTSIQYATVSNNPTKTTYTTAWADRASLTYQNYSEAF